MVLVDTSVWIDHLGRTGDLTLQALLEDGQVLTHPFVIGELAMGSLSRRDIILDSLMALPSAGTASQSEALHVLNRFQLYGMGIGYVDLHLLASTLLTKETSIWTRDKRLRQTCEKANVSVFAER